MPRKKQERAQFRYYDIPSGSYILPLLGETWIRDYGHDIYELHFHNHLEIGYCYDGEGSLILGNRNCSYFPETFSIIPANYPHNTVSKKGQKSYWQYLFVDVDHFLHDMYGTQNRSVDELIQRINGGAFFLTYEKNQRMGDLIQEIIREFRDQKEFYLESVKGYLLALLFEIARLQEDKKDTRHLLNSKDTSQIEPALTYVQEHYAESIKIQELAEQCSLSETHFRRIFEKKLQISPVDYINQIRIHKACLLLRDTYSSIEEIAMKTGFISMSTFNRNFRKLLGTSPKQWRKEMEDNGGSIKKYVISVEHGWE